METKECKDCHEVLPESEFTWIKKDKRKWLSSYCKKCCTTRAKRGYLFRTYGLSLEDKQKMILDQDNRCGICNNVFCNPKDTHVDHCHSSGKVRKLLCTNCNTALGKFKDDKEILKKAIKYLEEN